MRNARVKLCSAAFEIPAAPGGGFDRRADRTPPRFDGVAHTFEELVQKQRAADAAHATVEDLRETYGPPAERGMTGAQSGTFETALRA